MKRKISHLILILIFFTLECHSQDNLLSHQLGAVKSVRKSAQSTIITTTDNREVRLSVFSPTVIRVWIAPAGMPENPSYAVIRNAAPDFKTFSESKSEILLSTDSLKIRVRKDPLRIDFFNMKGEWLDGDDPSLGVSWQGEEVTSYRKLGSDEKFIGLGEKTGPLNRREQSYVNWNTDAPGYGQMADPIYSTMPYFIGIQTGKVFGIFFDNSYRSFFNFGGSTDGKMYFFGAAGGAMNYYFIGSSTIPAQIKDYTWLTGRMEMPPLWSLGYQQCRYSYMSQEQLLSVARRMRMDSIPCDVFYCDIDYMRGYRVFTWNPVTFPHPETLTDSLGKMGMHLVTIVDPGIKIDSNGYQPYITGLKGNMFAHYPDGKPYTGSVWAGRSHFPDFTKKDARKWWGTNFKALTDAGVTGFWNDMNEPAAWGQNIPPLIEFGESSNRTTLKQSRNIYGMQMARATFEGTKDLLNGNRPFVLTRAAYSGIQRFSAMWTGDNNPTDDHMILAYRLINSMGMTGEAFDGVDIGGFTGNPTPELMVRWMSLGTYTPLFRSHTAVGNTAHEPWAWGEQNEIFIRKSIQTRYRLLPYLYSAFHEATLNGMPVNRSLAINYTDCSEVFDQRFENEFLFGPSILVAPVASYRDAVQVYLPSGSWYRFDTDEKFEGNKVIWAPSPLNSLPVFIKSGAIIPMQNTVQSTSVKGDGVMYLNIWYSKNPNSFSYYEDDGMTYEYKQGRYYEREIKLMPQSSEITLEKVNGDYKTRFSGIKLILHGFPSTTDYSVNGKPVKAAVSGSTQTLFFPAEDGKITVKW